MLVGKGVYKAGTPSGVCGSAEERDRGEGEEKGVDLRDTKEVE